eukprot:3121297-Rhodomonas_salina.3
MKSGGTLLKPLIWLPKFDHCDLRSTWTVPLSDWRLQSRDGCLLALRGCLGNFKLATQFRLGPGVKFLLTGRLSSSSRKLASECKSSGSGHWQVSARTY